MEQETVTPTGVMAMQSTEDFVVPGVRELAHKRTFVLEGESAAALLHKAGNTVTELAARNLAKIVPGADDLLFTEPLVLAINIHPPTGESERTTLHMTVEGA